MTKALAALDAAPPAPPRRGAGAGPPAPPPRGLTEREGEVLRLVAGPDRPADRGRAGAERGHRGASPDQHLRQAGRRLARDRHRLRPARRARLRGRPAAAPRARRRATNVASGARRAEWDVRAMAGPGAGVP